MKLFTELRTYLDTNFNGIKLLQPLFFNDIPGLRFDLQDTTFETGNRNYFIEVVKRMDRIHYATISDSDVIMLLYQKYAFKRRKIRLGNYLFKQINHSTANIEFRRNNQSITGKYGDDLSPSDGSCQVIIKDKACNINFHNLYVAVSHMDFGVEPYLTNTDGELFIVNLTRNTITLMYDDRGCDIISLDASLLKSYYNALSNLILEPNRPQIIEQLQIEH